MHSRARVLASAATFASMLALTGCAAGETAQPGVTGAVTTYENVEALRDAFVAAGGQCPQWEPIDPGKYTAEAGRCSDSIVLAVYADPAELADAVQRAKDLAVPAHLLVGENWLLNIDEPQTYVGALGGTVVTG